MSEPDIFYILKNRERRNLLNHLTYTECYFSLLSRRANASPPTVSKHLKTMEREGILRSYEKKGDSKGPIRKYYSIAASRTFLVTVAPNIFQYKGLDLNAPEGFGRFEIKLDELDRSPENLHSMIAAFINANRKLDQIVEVLKAIECYRDNLMENIKKTYLKEVGDVIQFAILHYLLLYERATVEQLSDVLNLKEREIREKINELSKVIPLIMRNDVIEIDKEKLICNV